MADGSEIAVLEARLQRLEEAVYAEEVEQRPEPAVETLANFQSLVGISLEGYDRIKQAWRKLEDIEKFLDPAFVDRLTLPDTAKAEIVLSAEKDIKTLAAQLEELQKMKDVFDSEHVRATANYTSQLHSLAQVHIDQQEQAEVLTDDVRRMLSEYNRLVDLMSKQFVLWDETLTKYETANLPKKSGAY
ncbi:Hypp2633 [Branchiostoma lanceolatum]|uniref:Hypp2633 protein n=1 Tax=Branchiostoma lanceolatum TaxID=7740 RepID=A0A8J9ZT78_BRALA|nr:Hypp2633 [Branchiostoma lanceolatum]